MSFIKELEKEYKKLEDLGAEKIVIGKTFLGREICAFAIGCGEPRILVQCAIHAREYITYYLALKYIRQLLNLDLKGKGTIYVVPVVNIDGVALVIDGEKSIKNKKVRDFVRFIGKGEYKLWKANARGVDLNVNFPARFGTGASNEFRPSSSNYVGRFAGSESEVRALMNFTKFIKPTVVLCFHSKGEVIFYDFYQKGKQKRRDKAIAKVVSKSTGYKIRPTGKSAGGFKDWCVESLGITGITVEVGEEKLVHPIEIDFLEKIWEKTKNVLIDLLDYFHNFKYN